MAAARGLIRTARREQAHALSNLGLHCWKKTTLWSAYYKLLQSGKENTGKMSRFRGSIGYELDMHGQWGESLLYVSEMWCCVIKRGDTAREILQASAACFALLALSGIQACFRERERGPVGSGLV